MTMPTNRSADDQAADDRRDEEDRPSVRQLLHAATGDRDAEAKALADRTDDDVTEEDAKVAVRRAEGDVQTDDRPERDVASPEDAEAVHEER
jgi:hypothetical protein